MTHCPHDSYIVPIVYIHDRLIAAKGALQKQHLANAILLGEPTVCILYAIVYNSMWEYHRIVYCGIEQDVAVCSSR